MTINRLQYLICSERGHKQSGRGVTEGSGPTWNICAWCRCRFRWTEPILIVHPKDAIEAEHGTT